MHLHAIMRKEMQSISKAESRSQKALATWKHIMIDRSRILDSEAARHTQTLFPYVNIKQPVHNLQPSTHPLHWRRPLSKDQACDSVRPADSGPQLQLASGKPARRLE